MATTFNCLTCNTARTIRNSEATVMYTPSKLEPRQVRISCPHCGMTHIQGLDEKAAGALVSANATVHKISQPIETARASIHVLPPISEDDVTDFHHLMGDGVNIVGLVEMVDNA